MHLQDLKTGAWDHFFGQTRELCSNHLGGNAGREFFALLTSQLLQRMLKSGSSAKLVKDPKEMDFLCGFVKAMRALLQDCPTALGDDDSLLVSTNVGHILDFGSTPQDIMNANNDLAKSEHWLAKAFCLDKGKKLMALAVENADKRSSQSNILESIKNQVQSLEEQAYLNAEEYFMATYAMDAKYGSLLLGL